jgi:hypothetical protein
MHENQKQAERLNRYCFTDAYAPARRINLVTQTPKSQCLPLEANGSRQIARLFGVFECDLDLETDMRREEDFGTSFGPPLTMTSLTSSEEAAWVELDWMLRLWATHVQRGTPMTKDESLEIFGGSRGEHRNILSKVIDTVEKREGTKHT